MTPQEIIANGTVIYTIKGVDCDGTVLEVLIYEYQGEKAAHVMGIGSRPNDRCK
jgi:hypothetical protein